MKVNNGKKRRKNSGIENTHIVEIAKNNTGRIYEPAVVH